MRNSLLCFLKKTISQTVKFSSIVLALSALLKGMCFLVWLGIWADGHHGGDFHECPQFTHRVEPCWHQNHFTQRFV